MVDFGPDLRSSGHIRPQILMPLGGTVTVSVPPAPDRHKEFKLQVGSGTIQTWPNWLAIALTRVQEVYLARQRIVAVSANEIDPTMGRLIGEEYQASLQTISAAVFALDAFYGVLDGMIHIPDTERAARTQRRDGRAIWVADAIIRATGRMPNDVRKNLKKNIHRAFKVVTLLYTHRTPPSHSVSILRFKTSMCRSVGSTTALSRALR